jgi:hypothetical protein
MSEARARRVEQNEHLFAAVNEAIRGVNARLDLEDGSEQYICECSVQDCTQRVSLTPDEYAEARSNRRWFFMIAGHRDPAHEEIVRETDRYVLVEKVE